MGKSLKILSRIQKFNIDEQRKKLSEKMDEEAQVIDNIKQLDAKYEEVITAVSGKWWVMSGKFLLVNSYLVHSPTNKLINLKTHKLKSPPSSTRQLKTQNL